MNIRLDGIWQFLTSTDFLLWVVWSGMALLTISLLILMQTRWGRSRPLRKCVVLSLVAHLLFLSYAATVKIVTNGRGRSEDTKIQIADDVPQEHSQDPETRELAAWNGRRLPSPMTNPLPWRRSSRSGHWSVLRWIGWIRCRRRWPLA